MKKDESCMKTQGNLGATLPNGQPDFSLYNFSYLDLQKKVIGLERRFFC